MPPSCRQFQDSCIERAGDPGALESALESALTAHRASCTECDAFAQRIDAQARALQGLERMRAPLELAGLVVATFHEGQRQDRAVAALGALGRKPAPDELDRAVLHAHGVFDASELDGDGTGVETDAADGSARADDAGRLHAPHVLDRLVDEELREPSKALVRRFAGRLPRLTAPSELDARVARMLATGARAPRSTRGPLLRAAALLVVFGAGAGVLFWFGGRESKAAELIAVRIERVHSPAELGPEARALLGGLTGGLSEFGTTIRSDAEFESNRPGTLRGEPR